MRYDVLKEGIISKEMKQMSSKEVHQRTASYQQLDLHLICSNAETMVTSLQYDIHGKLKISRLVYDKVRNSR